MRSLAPVREIAEPSGMGAGLVRIAALAAYVGAINVVAFHVFAWDKVAAAAGRNRRTPERTLLALTAAGGTLGALAARWLLRHKTRKQPFRTLFWLIVAVQAGLIAALGLVGAGVSPRAGASSVQASRHETGKHEGRQGRQGLQGADLTDGAPSAFFAALRAALDRPSVTMNADRPSSWASCFKQAARLDASAGR